MEATHDQPGSCRARPVIADDDLEDIRWIRGVGGEELPTASYALLPNLKKVLCSSPKPEERPFFAIGEGSRILVACLRRSSTQMCWNQTPGRRPPPVTGRFMNTVVTRGWARAPDERPPFRFHGAVVDFVHRCLSRTRNLADSSKHLAEFFSGRSWPKISPRFFFFGVFEKFETFSFKICAHGERYRNRLAGIYEIPTFLEASRFHSHRNTEVPTSYVHSVTIELAKLILVGTWTTYQATVDAYHF